MYYLEPYKSRTYAILTEDMESASFKLEFDCGQFFHIAEEKALYLYANFTKVGPTPTVKFKPESFIWNTPVTAVFIFHYDRYQVNTKAGDTWVKEDREPAAIERLISNHILKSNAYFNGCLSGIIDYSNSSLIAQMLSGDDEATRIKALESILNLQYISKTIEGFNPPEFNKSKSSGNNSYGGFGAKKGGVTLGEKYDFLLKTVANLLEVPFDQTNDTGREIIKALTNKKNENLEEYSSLMDFLKLL